MNKGLPLGIGIAVIAIAVLAFSLSDQSLEDVETSVNVESDTSIKQKETTISSECLGTAGCITGTVTSVIDGDTLEVDGQAVRFALVDTPKMKYDGGQALSFLEQICPVGSPVLIDQDDQQLEDAYGRVLGMVYCNDLNVNKELLDSGLGDLYSTFCDQSEFATQPWAQKHGCDTFENETSIVNDIGYSMSSDELEQ